MDCLCEENIQIEESRIILVEGIDELNLINSLLKSMNIERVQVLNVGGKDKFKAKINTLSLRTDYFDSIDVIGIVRDAEENLAKSAFDSTCGCLKDHSLPFPKAPGQIVEESGKRVGIFISPDNNRPGMIEDICLESISNDLKCVDSFVTCLEADGSEPKNPAKTRMLAYLASKDPNKYRLGMIKWNFEHEAFNGLNAFFSELLK